MITSMLEKAFETIPDGTGLILHSDQGWQYQHKQYQRMLRRKGIRQSMSRKGNCLDNAVMENFFGLLKSELLYLQEFRSLDHFKQELVDYLDYYNNRRIKAKLMGLPPALHRQQALSVAWTIPSEILSNFSGSLHFCKPCLFFLRNLLDLLTKIKYRLRNHSFSPHFIRIYCRKDGLSHPLEV